MWGWNRQMWEKSKGTTQWEKNRADAMLVLLNMIMKH